MNEKYICPHVKEKGECIYIEETDKEPCKHSMSHDLRNSCYTENYSCDDCEVHFEFIEKKEMEVL